MSSFSFGQKKIIAVIGSSTAAGTGAYSGMPAGFIHPSGRPGYDAGSNVTMALSLKADILLVSFPSNDIADGYPSIQNIALATIYMSMTRGTNCYTRW